MKKAKIYQVKLFFLDCQIVVEPDKLCAPSGDKVRFRSKDGGFSVEFKKESPFISGAGGPGEPIVSSDGSLTKAETLKPIANKKKRFPYSVTLCDVTLDPEIIIDDGWA